MKILHINTSDINGGAAKAAHRLHTALNNQGVDSYMLVQYKYSSDDKVIIYTPWLFNKLFKKINHIHKKKIDRLMPKAIFNDIFSAYTTKRLIKKINPDIIQLHWINGFFNVNELKSIGLPIVWSTHDMWPFTGGCHYDEGCGKYKNECGSCPILRSDVDNDLSRIVFKSKYKILSTIENLTVVGLSKWIANCASESAIFKDKKIVNLPNPIDTEIFKPIGKKSAKQKIGLDTEGKVILFGAMGATIDLRKGFLQLVEAIEKISTKTFMLLILGSEKPNDDFFSKFQVKYLGRVDDENQLALIYNAADVMVSPSLQENLSNSIVEGMASGLPVVAFDIGGNGDLITHKVNGYLAKPFSPDDLACGIDWVLKTEKYTSLVKSAREKVMMHLSNEVVSLQYQQLYLQILNNNGYQ